MANFWTAPKVNWTDNDGIGYADFNRIEQNTDAVRDATKRRVQGFGYGLANDNPSYDGYIVIQPGNCYSENGVPISTSGYFAKNLTAWSQGNGIAFGCLAPGAAIGIFKWMYLFVISNPIDGSVEYMIDDNVSGTNVASVVYTEKRYINCFRTKEAGTHSSYVLAEMYSTGDHVFINPLSISAQPPKFATGDQTINVYTTQTLNRAVYAPAIPNLDTPARNVLAQFDAVSFNCHVGLYSVGYGFTIPATFLPAGSPPPNAEVSFLNTHGSGYNSAQFQLKVNASGQVSLALYAAGGAGWVELRVNMFYDDRLWLA